MAAVALCIALGGGRAFAHPKARCTAARSDSRILVEVALEDFPNRDLLRLIRLGLDGRIKVKARLMRDRSYWFDESLETRTITLKLTWARRLGYLIDGSLLRDPDLIWMPAISLSRGKRRSGSLYVEVDEKLQVVTTSSLQSTARLLRGAKGEGALGGLVMDMVVEDLTRSDGTSCRARRPK